MVLTNYVFASLLRRRSRVVFSFRLYFGLTKSGRRERRRLDYARSWLVNGDGIPPVLSLSTLPSSHRPTRIAVSILFPLPLSEFLVLVSSSSGPHSCLYLKLRSKIKFWQLGSLSLSLSWAHFVCRADFVVGGVVGRDPGGAVCMESA